MQCHHFCQQCTDDPCQWNWKVMFASIVASDMITKKKME
jgi:hypothetical protein